jgi:hypothetical protein
MGFCGSGDLRRLLGTGGFRNCRPWASFARPDRWKFDNLRKSKAEGAASRMHLSGWPLCGSSSCSAHRNFRSQRRLPLQGYGECHVPASDPHTTDPKRLWCTVCDDRFCGGAVFRRASFRWVRASFRWVKETTPQSDYANHGGVIAPGTADPGYYFDRLWRQR